MTRSQDDPSSIVLEFRRRLVTARRKAGFTQTELAERLGCSPSWISRVERGQRILDVMEYLEWMKALEQDPLKWLRQWMDLTPEDKVPGIATIKRKENKKL